MKTRLGSGLREEKGQLLAFFAIALVVLIAMVGVVIDGGTTFVQRRDMQNVADSAAMAGGYALVNGGDATAAAQANAATNGYTNGVNGASVAVTVGTRTVKVDISAPHRNAFAGIMGFASWNVATTATTTAGTPNAVVGALPLIFNRKAFDNSANRDETSPTSFDEPGTGSNDIPKTDKTFNWTVYCTGNGNPCNADSNTVDDLINGTGATTTVKLNDGIAPLNAGSHTTLFSDLSNHVGDAYPVGIVDDTGALVGWAWFHITGSSGGSTKQVSGWFESAIDTPDFKIISGGGTAQGTFGGWAVDLTN